MHLPAGVGVSGAVTGQQRAGSSGMSAHGARRQSSVPASRLGRLLGLGLAAGELVLGGMAEGVRRLAEGERLGAGEMLLTGPNVRRLAQRLARLRGAAMKLGQLLSLEGEDLLPREAAAALAVLRAGAEPMPLAQSTGPLAANTARAGEPASSGSTTSRSRPPRSARSIAPARASAARSR